MLWLIVGIFVAQATAQQGGTRTCRPDDDVAKAVAEKQDGTWPPDAKPLKVEIDLWVEKIISIKDGDTMKAKFMFYLNSKWTDSRTKFDDMRPCTDNVTMTGHLVKMWKPDSRYVNNYDEQMHRDFMLVFRYGLF